jgi:hypothetical protein
MITNYNQFKEESLLESILLESKLIFSDKLINLLNTIPPNKIKDELLKLSKGGEDLNLVQNYFDLGNSKEEITFIQDRRAQQILGDQPVKFVTTNGVGNAYLTFNKKDDQYVNRAIFDALGFDADSVPHQNPGENVVGDIMGEVPSKKLPGKVYVLFKWGENNACVINKQFVIPYDDRYDRIWSLTKNPIRIGRVVNSLLSIAKITATPKEIEDFVNAYKSSWDIMNDAFLKFDIVKEGDIAYWYSNENYEDGGRSTLGNSCMAEVDSSYFDIYVKNPDVCQLVILYGDKGQLVDGKWKSDRIKGRALLWKTSNGEMFMDRIYYNYESDVDLFKQFAEKNDWWCKKHQDSDSGFTAQKGNQHKNPSYTVRLSKSTFDAYPYVDTLTYIDFSGKTLSNERDGADAELCSTGGEYDEI